jgi:N-acetyl-alpha-D-muramate 1-phosphate uridylyltransferase
MTQNALTTAMVLAAGLGTRMRPITLTLPKPLVAIDGKPMLDHALDRLKEAGVTQAVVNVHYLAEQIMAHVSTRTHPSIAISDERGLLLETGGGIKKALPLLESDPFWLMNSDSLWIEHVAQKWNPVLRHNMGANKECEHASSALNEMAQFWDSDQMDILLLLADRITSMGYDGRGDFSRAPSGHLTRREKDQNAPFVYAGVAILKPELFSDTPEGAFSLNLLFDRAIAQNRLFGHLLNGEWLHVGTPDAIQEAEERINRAR